MGNREDMRYVRFSDREGNSLLIESQGRVNFSALHFTDTDLRDCRHDFELRPMEQTVLHLDYMQRGLGNKSCGPDAIDKYTIPSSGTYSYKLRFTPGQICRPVAGMTCLKDRRQMMHILARSLLKIMNGDIHRQDSPKGYIHAYFRNCSLSKARTMR